MGAIRHRPRALFMTSGFPEHSSALRPGLTGHLGGDGALGVGLCSLLIADHSPCVLPGLPGGDPKVREERWARRHFMVFEDAVDHGVYALFMT